MGNDFLRWIYSVGWVAQGIIWFVGLVVLTRLQLRREFGPTGEAAAASAARYRLWPATGLYRESGWDIVPDVVVQGEEMEVVEEGARVVPGLGSGAFRFSIEGDGRLYATALRSARLNGRPMSNRPEPLANDDTIDAGGAHFRIEVRTA
jgi:hypothetical protein